MEQVVALYKYQRQNPDELSFEKGCVINVINKIESDWWTGELNGQTGVFPSNYVVPLSSVSDFDQLSTTATCEFFCDLLLGLGTFMLVKILKKQFIVNKGKKPWFKKYLASLFDRNECTGLLFLDHPV